MGRATLSLFVVANLLICPYLCLGIISFGCGPVGCGDACCAAGERPDRDLPNGSGDRDPCKRLGTSCVCTGAPADDSRTQNLERIESQATRIFVPDRPRSVAIAVIEPHSLSPPPIAGAALRTQLQSWLI